MPQRPVVVRCLGTVPYEDALALQQSLVDRRKRGEIPDTLLLLQHPHVVTLGVRGDGGRGHILAPAARLAELGVRVVETGRGGDVTYHGPGQLVAYPIVDLDPDRRDVHRYVRDLEEVMIRVCATFGLAAGRIPGKTGTWLHLPVESTESTSGAAAKIGAIGVRISRWVTSHGIALNVWTDLEYFRLIVPCGIAEYGVTSLERELGARIPMEDVEARFVQKFGDVFGRRIVLADPAAE
ncbi:MAG: lipoyl(octanoyl) transferase LipB [Vicinamibacterales bacterium]